MQMAYPDGEVLTYHYDSGGLVDAVNGVKADVRTDYLTRLEYDKFEQRVFLELGNGLKTAYAYDPLTRRLCALNTAKDAQPTACRDFESAPDTACRRSSTSTTQSATSWGSGTPSPCRPPASSAAR